MIFSLPTTKKGALHKHNALIKFLETALFVTAIYKVSLLRSLFLLSVLVALFVWAGVPIYRLKKRLLLFLGFFVLLYLLTGALTVPGEPLWRKSYLTREGLIWGAMKGWRFCLLFLTGILFYVTTDPMEIGALLYRILSPLSSFLPIAPLAVGVSLALSFIPMIFEKAQESRLAIQARGLSAKLRPLRFAITITFSIITRLLLKSHEIAYAMEARGFNPERPFSPQTPPPSIKEWTLGVAVAGCFVFLIWLP